MLNKTNIMVSSVVAVLGLVLASTAFAGSTTNKGANPNGKPFIELDGQIVEVEGEVSTLQDQVDALVGQVATLEEKADANMTAIAALEARSAELQHQIDMNGDDIASLQLQVSEMEAENLDLQAQMDLLGDADGYLQGLIDANNALITTLNQSISNLSVSLQDQIDNNSDLIALLQDEIDRIDAELAEKQNLVDGICRDGSAVKQILATGDVICESVGSGGGGSLQTVISYGSCVKVKTSSSGGTFATAIAYCPKGYMATGTGWHGHNMSEIDEVWASGNRAGVSARSRYHLCAQVTCARIAP